VVALAFSADGRTLVSASTDGSARVWDVARRTAVAELRHPAPVDAVDISADGRYVVTGSFDGSSRVWQVPDGLLLATLWGSPSIVTSIDLASDDRTIVAAGTDSVARVYKCDLCGTVDDLVRYATLRLHRRLTAAERARYLHQKG
jgi:WD40 repeat protein